jgi:hypothetical protein
MIGFLTSSLGLKLAKWGAIILAVLAVLFAVRQSGKHAERVANLEGALKTAQRRRDVETEIARLPDGAVAQRLRDKWRRD